MEFLGFKAPLFENLRVNKRYINLTSDALNFVVTHSNLLAHFLSSISTNKHASKFQNSLVPPYK